MSSSAPTFTIENISDSSISNIFSKDSATATKINKGRKSPSFSEEFLKKKSSDAKISNGFESHQDETFLDIDASFTDEHLSKSVSEDNVAEVVFDDNYAELKSESMPRNEIEADITSLELKNGFLKGHLESESNNNLSKEPEEGVSSSAGPFTNDSSDWEREEWIDLISRDKFPIGVYEKSCDTQEVDSKGNTLLHYSAYFGSTDYTLQLLDAGWNLNSKNIQVILFIRIILCPKVKKILIHLIYFLIWFLIYSDKCQKLFF